MYRKIIKVFLGSPGDLEEERKAAKLIVDEENANHANDLNYHIDLVGWEDTVSQRRRAQDAINVELDQCEYFVGLMWKKWGTPPGPSGHPYSSGFEEEFERSVARHEATGKPEISLLFKDLSKDDLVDVGPQLEKVLAFQRETTEGKKQYYQKFQDLRDFERKFRATIAKFLKDQQREDKNSEALEQQNPTKTEDRGKAQEKSGNGIGAFDANERRFLDEFVAKQYDGENSYSAAEAARFRLLACTVRKSGNDIARLGTHDANLIYRDLRDVKFSFGERNVLVSTAIETFGSSTVPLWHWIFDADFQLYEEFLQRTLWREEKHRINAFKLIAKLGISPNDLNGSSKIDLAKHWFAKDVSNDLIISALEYLGEVGDDGLQVNWEDFVGRSEANIATAAVKASARIKLRSNLTEALKFVAQHEGTDLGAKLAEELTENISTVETEVLRECLNNKTKAFQRAIAEQLFSRAALTIADVQLICESTEADVRLIGVKALARQKPELSEAEARKILVKPRKSGFTGLASLISSPRDRDYSGENALKSFKIGELGQQRFDQLLSIQKAEPLYSTEATLALYRYHFNRVKAQLTKSLLDGFDQFFADRHPVAGMTPAEAVIKFMKDELLQSALEAFCCGATKPDLTTVRKVLDAQSIKFSPEIAKFLAKHGEWEDVARVNKLANNLKYGLGMSLLSMFDTSLDYKHAAKAILKLGAKRIADAWSTDIPDEVRVHFVVQMPAKLFAVFDDQRIIKMLLLESDAVRETVALKAVLCFSKTRIRRILDAYYTAGESYYYNVIFWLDLGLAADRKTRKAVALKEIEIK